MKFGDKLMSLRKKHGLSQEELAAKLNVSRQSVSKWESNNTYPETDKIVQICNIFDCKMDDLINDKVVDVTQCERKSKNNITIVFDSFLEFITKTINMFISMKFTSKLKCLIELGLLILCLVFMTLGISSLATELVMNIFRFLDENLYYGLYHVIKSILEILLAGVSTIIIVHIFKIRYLDYYDKVMAEEKTIDKDDNKENNNDNSKNDEAKGSLDDNKGEISNDKKTKFKLKTEPKIVIRDKHTAFAFLATLSKIVIGIFKFIVLFFALGFMLALVGLCALLVLSIYFSKYSLLFIGIDIALVASIIMTLIVLLIMIYFIINRQTNKKVLSIVFLAALIIFGVGSGLGVLGAGQFNYAGQAKDYGEQVLVEKEFEIADDMVVMTNYMHEYAIKIDNNIKDNLVKASVNSNTLYVNDFWTWTGDTYGIKELNINLSRSFKPNELFNLIITDVKNNTIKDYSIDESPYIIYCNEKTAEKLIGNMKKIYLFTIEKFDNGYKLENFDKKIYLSDQCEMRYDAKNDKYVYDNDCICKREDKSTTNGNIIDFYCYYKTYNESHIEEE